MPNEIGVLLPNGVPGCSGETIRAWCRLADEGPFSSVGVADRYVYVNHETMMTLAAAAVLTSRVRLISAAFLGPLRPVPLFAKQVATLAALAPGRVSLGVAVGNRTNDYDAAGIDWTRRGKHPGRAVDSPWRRCVTWTATTTRSGRSWGTSRS